MGITSIYYLPYLAPKPVALEDTLVGSEEVSALDDFIHLRSGFLKRKLETFAALIKERLRLKNLDHGRIDSDRDFLKTPLAPYRSFRERDATMCYQRKLDLSKEARLQDIQCFQDLVPLVRDFLNVRITPIETRGRKHDSHVRKPRPLCIELALATDNLNH